jgi:hypothetical protein
MFDTRVIGSLDADWVVLRVPRFPLPCENRESFFDKKRPLPRAVFVRPEPLKAERTAFSRKFYGFSQDWG